MNPTLLLKTLRQLGISAIARITRYRLALRLGVYTRRGCPAKNADSLLPVLALPSSEEITRILQEEEKDSLRAEAESILEGKYRPFGGDETPLKLTFDSPLQHWSVYERNPAKLRPFYDSPPFDIKFLWEPARFTWVFPLGRAYRVFGDARYAAAFWTYFETFDAGNPPCLGPQWMNGQEVALRLLALLWADALFADSPESSPKRRARLAASVAEHAARIPQTLEYALAQNNNHILSEAAALMSAGLALPRHPDSARWRRLGKYWFNRALLAQIDDTGEYIQHSTSYHRLMLSLALWVAAMEEKTGESLLTAQTRERLAAAAAWLAAWVHPLSGDAPNLGGNDGANLFPLANGGYRDFRPVAQAAARAFLGIEAFPRGAWDELSRWFRIPAPPRVEPPAIRFPILEAGDTRAYLRVARGNLRLAHADMLHVDLWQRGRALLLDPGTYLYNGEPPWENPWSATKFHNTVTVDSLDAMTRAGRFLYLDWARTRVLAREENRIVAAHEGYRRLGVSHRREIRFETARHLLVTDTLIAAAPHRYRLHWLFPDGRWEISRTKEEIHLRLSIPQTGGLHVALRGAAGRAALIRGGQLLWGEGHAESVEGWFSPTYGIKLPALSFSLEVFAEDGVQFVTEFHLSA
jgi:hypothetical protein